MRRASDKVCGENGWAVGIDVGGTKVAAAVVRFPKGEIGEVHEFSTKPQRGSGVVLHDVEALTVKVLERAGNQQGRFFGVGMGVCELVDREGELRSANCIGWKAKQVRQALGRFGMVKIEADVRAAALAESLFGAGKDTESFLYVTVGTGISSCLVIEGKPFAGARGTAGTMASGPFPDFGGRIMPSLEAVASGPALVESFQARGGKADSAQEVLKAAEDGDEKAMISVRKGARGIGGAIGWLINVLDPEVVVMGGGLGTRRGLYRRMIVEAAKEHVWWEGHRNVKIVSAGTGALAGVIGAAARLWEEVSRD